jgi:hypothetical protein
MSFSHIVSAFEEVDVVEQAFGEGLSPVASGPDVGVVEPEPIVSFEQDKPRCIKLFLEFYKSLSLLLWFTTLSN